MTTMFAHESVKRLIAAGFTEEQAEQITNISLSHPDGAVTQAELKIAISELKSEIKEVKFDILKWIIPFLIAIIIAIFLKH